MTIPFDVDMVADDYSRFSAANSSTLQQAYCLISMLLYEDLNKTM